MTDADALHNRGRSLENAFFSNLDQQLLDGLREKLDLETTVTQFRQATGIQDAKVLEGLYHLGVTPASLAALRVFPMIAVAWADGEVDANEVVTIQAIAGKYIQEDSAAAKLLQSWLKKQPSGDMLATWKAYAASMFSSLGGDESSALKKVLIEEINEVATASGGILGWGSVSRSEQNVLEQIHSLLQ
jgi:hypothetical protein